MPSRALVPTSRGALYHTDSFGQRVPYKPKGSGNSPLKDNAPHLAAGSTGESYRVVGWWLLPAPAVLSMLALPVMLAGLVLFRAPAQRRPRSQSPTTAFEAGTDAQTDA